MPTFLITGDLRRRLDVNGVGPVALTQHALPLLRAAKGRIVDRPPAAEPGGLLPDRVADKLAERTS